MPEYGTHARYATAAHLALSVVTILAVGLGAPTVLLVGIAVGYPATLAGAGFPDVDHPSSKPYLFVKTWLPRAIAGVTGVVLVAERSLVIDLVAATSVLEAPSFVSGAACAGVVVAVHRGTRRTIPVLRPPHRSVTHSVVVAVGIAAFLVAVVATVCLALEAPAAYEVGLVVGACFAAGTLSHLFVDGEIPRGRAGGHIDGEYLAV